MTTKEQRRAKNLSRSLGRERVAIRDRRLDEVTIDDDPPCIKAIKTERRRQRI